MKAYRFYFEFTKGLWKENPVFFQLLGMCPTLAVTTTARNGFSMGLAVIFVLTCSGMVISAIRRFVPSEVRIPVFVVIIASFVTIIDLVFKAQLPEVSKALGPYIPLIVVNCIILGRMEAFVSKNPLSFSILDTLGMGIGFTLALVILGSVRELLGSGAIFNFQILGDYFHPWVIMILPPGAFLTLGVLIGFINKFSRQRA